MLSIGDVASLSNSLTGSNDFSYINSQLSFLARKSVCRAQKKNKLDPFTQANQNARHPLAPTGSQLQKKKRNSRLETTTPNK